MVGILPVNVLDCNVLMCLLTFNFDWLSVPNVLLYDACPVGC